MPPEFKPQRHGSAVLIASSAAADPRRGVHARHRLGTATKSKGDLAGTIPDIAAAYSILLVCLGIAIRKMFVDVDPETVNRNAVLRSLRKEFDSCKDFVVVYYTGHGQAGTGSWCFEELGTKTLRFISFQDVAEIWHARNNCDASQRLYLVVDACFSGKWAAAATRDDGIIVRASCGESDLAMEDASGGLWTSAWAKEVAAVADRFDPEKGLSYVTSGLQVDDRRAIADPESDAINGDAGQMWLALAEDGVIVREEASSLSKQYVTKLSKGTLLMELASKGPRLRYRKASLGRGPEEGWITKRTSNAALVVKSEMRPSSAIVCPNIFFALPSSAQQFTQAATAKVKEAEVILGFNPDIMSRRSVLSSYLCGVISWEMLVACTPNLMQDRLVFMGYEMGGICVALFAAGCLTFDQGLRLAQQLDEAREKSRTKSMFLVRVVGLPEGTILRYCTQVSEQ